MSQLTFTSIPGFVDLPDSQLAADAVVTDDALVKINQNAKFAAVRVERIYMGYYKSGDAVGVPVSPVDGYSYSRPEVQYDFELVSTRPPGAGFVSGQAGFPGIGPSQEANFYALYECVVDDSTGQVTIVLSYFKQGGQETVHNDHGIVKVYAECQRLSVNVPS